MCVHEDILISIIMQSRLSDPKTSKFRADLGFNQINLILKKEQSVVIPLLKAFSAEYERVRTDMYFFEHKRVVEIDEKGHTDRNQNEENEKQIKIENILTENVFTGLILMQRVLIFFLKLVKYRVTLLNQIKKN